MSAKLALVMISTELSTCQREDRLLGEVIFEKELLTGASVPPALSVWTLNESKEKYTQDYDLCYRLKKYKAHLRPW